MVPYPLILSTLSISLTYLKILLVVYLFSGKLRSKSIMQSLSSFFCVTRMPYNPSSLLYLSTFFKRLCMNNVTLYTQSGGSLLSVRRIIITSLIPQRLILCYLNSPLTRL